MHNDNRLILPRESELGRDSAWTGYHASRHGFQIGGCKPPNGAPPLQMTMIHGTANRYVLKRTDRHSGHPKLRSDCEEGGHGFLFVSTFVLFAGYIAV